jgi:enoyl-CoA hydratase/carnithine racemase
VSIRVSSDGAIARIVLDRPERANAYTQPMLTEIGEALDRLEADRAVSVLIVTGAGARAFSAGADRTELAERSPESVLRLRAAEVFQRLHDSRLVSLASLNGAAVGGGLELALACDLRIAADHAEMWLPEPELGLLPAAGALQRLPAAVGDGPARELILGGARWSAARALALGLVAEVVAAAELEAVTERWAIQITRRAPLALELAKRSLARPAEHGHADFDQAAQALLVARSRNSSS